MSQNHQGMSRTDGENSLVPLRNSPITCWLASRARRARQHVIGLPAEMMAETNQTLFGQQMESSNQDDDEKEFDITFLELLLDKIIQKNVYIGLRRRSELNLVCIPGIS